MVRGLMLFPLSRWPLAFALICALISSAAPAGAQLAITEVMSSALGGPDYWELANFGTNEISLQGYSFRDSEPLHPRVEDPFTNLVIHPGEAIVFFEEAWEVATPDQFRAWWGEGKLPANFQCRVWSSALPGLSGFDGDGVWLFDPLGNVVDGVRFGRARQGRAFTYDVETGMFGVLSVCGVNGAFAAETTGDVGSPGTTTGPVPVRIMREPLDQAADMGASVTLTVAASGLPHPRFQWFARGEPIEGGNNATLVLSNVQPSEAGAYYVWITNGLSEAVSRAAMVTVNTNPRPPVVICPPKDATVFSYQDAVFTVVAGGFPAPHYQWRSDEGDIEGAVQPALVVEHAYSSQSGTRYSVRIWNELGETNVSASLTVAPRPDLRFTEVMALPANAEERRHFDWFELTNFDTNAVDLLGWRFAAEPEFAEAFTISNPLTLQPGESVVFVEQLDAELFAAWWGADSLPEDLQVYSFSGLGLRDVGATLYLWNSAATDVFDTVTTVSWALATPGVSFECERYCDADGINCLDEATTESVPGMRGAFPAADGGDIGSPGYADSPPLQILAIRREPEGAVTLRCRVSAGRTYCLSRSLSLTSPDWMPLESQTAASNSLTWRDDFWETMPACFYRLEEAPSP